MVDMERAHRQAALAEARKRLAEIELTADALITELRIRTDPRLVDDFVGMELDKAAELMESLKLLWNEAQQVAERIAKLREALGE